MSNYEPDIIFIDNHLLVINKPAGVLVQRDSSGDESLLDLCRAYIKKRFNKPGNVYLGLVHRLDRPASGVIVLARTSKAAGRLSEQFRLNQVKKIYWALVEGEVEKEADFSDRIARRGATSRLSGGREGQVARLSFRRLGFERGISLVEINLSTGRHHQIRVQFAGRGHPLVGDFRYGSSIIFGRKELALHSRSLTIFHPTAKEEMTFKAEAGNSWVEFLRHSCHITLPRQE